MIQGKAVFHRTASSADNSEQYLPTAVTLTDVDDEDDVRSTGGSAAVSAISADADGKGFSCPASMPMPMPMPIVTRYDKNRPQPSPVLLTAADRVVYAEDNAYDYRQMSFYPYSRPNGRPSQASHSGETEKAKEPDVVEWTKEPSATGERQDEKDEKDASTMADVAASLQRLTQATQAGTADIRRLRDAVSRLDRDVASVWADVEGLREDVQHVLDAAADAADADVADNESAATATATAFEHTHGFDNLHIYSDNGLAQGPDLALGRCCHCYHDSPPVVVHVTAQRRYGCGGNAGRGHSWRRRPTRRFPRMY